MTERAVPSRYIEAAAVLSGWPAYAFARVLRRELPPLLEALDPALRRPLEESLAALILAADAYARECRCGTSVPASAELRADSGAMDVMTTDQAADVLGCHARYVRRLALDGRLPGRREHHRWQLDAAAVLAYRDNHEQETAR